jgi:hypothetical protein
VSKSGASVAGCFLPAGTEVGVLTCGPAAQCGGLSEPWRMGPAALACAAESRQPMPTTRTKKNVWAAPSGAAMGHPFDADQELAHLCLLGQSCLLLRQAK